MSSTTQPINYANYVGFQSLAAPIVFAVAYVPLFGLFLFRSIRVRSPVHTMLAFFCLIRIAAFVLRSVLVGSQGAGENLNVLIADEVLFGVGFFSLLFSAYTLVLDLAQFAEHSTSQTLILRITQDRRFYKLVLLTAVALGIASSAIRQDGPGASDTDSTSNKLRLASTCIFLILTVLQAVQTAYLARLERIEPENYRRRAQSRQFGTRYGIIILLVISCLLILREAYSVAASVPSEEIRLSQEVYWYPLIALPEILAVILYGVPGLVPSKYEVKERIEEKEHRDSQDAIVPVA